jgi:hypothetical protein
VVSAGGAIAGSGAGGAGGAGFAFGLAFALAFGLGAAFLGAAFLGAAFAAAFAAAFGAAFLAAAFFGAAFFTGFFAFIAMSGHLPEFVFENSGHTMLNRIDPGANDFFAKDKFGTRNGRRARAASAADCSA